MTDAVLEDVKQWRSRPLERVYPIVYLDALVTKVHGDGGVSNRAVYVALGVNLEGQKEVLGLWLGENEGSKFWLRVLTEMKNRGLDDIFIACVDGLSGFSEAIGTVYPQTQVQSCIVHAVRNSLKFVSWKERKQVAADLKRIYKSPTRESAEQELREFREKWDSRHPIIGEQWERNWDKLSVLFAYPDDIRRAIYTTNAIESLNHSLRRVLKNKKTFPSEDALMKVLYLSIDCDFVGAWCDRFDGPVVIVAGGFEFIPGNEAASTANLALAPWRSAFAAQPIVTGEGDLGCIGVADVDLSSFGKGRFKLCPPLIVDGAHTFDCSGCLLAASVV